MLGSVAIFVTSIVMVPLLGTEFVPKADYSETSVSFYTPVGSSLELTEAKARQVEPSSASSPRCATRGHQHRRAQGKIYASVYVGWWTARTAAAASTRWRRAARPPQAGARHHRDARGPADAVGGNKQIEFSLQGPDLKELERLSTLVIERIHGIGPGGPGLQRQARQAHRRHPGAARRRLRPGPVGGADRRSLRTLVAGQTVGNWRAPDDQTYDVNVRLAPMRATRRQDLERLPFATGSNPTAARASCG